MNCKKCNKSGAKCKTCYSREWRKKNPIRSSYNNLKNNVKRRNKVKKEKGQPLIEFSISLEYFKKFCIKTNYIKLRGRKRDCYHVDRIKEHLGYIEGNLQILKNHENVSKYWINYRAEWDDREKRMIFETEINRPQIANTSIVPF